ncbi:hypothetical protein NM208_g2891 [Fusarium decemcellulare]|uniref:Uncharacterized protein n=1 Tax=Fusarium decemcellulare TaxID=57161 RepID=A0ACC1SR72_9HYPO|nr:hypothetical protein NM208_g2891 [Fusarium decemcellulare]
MATKIDTLDLTLSFTSLNDHQPSTIILLHGGLSCRLEWAEVVPLLSEYHVLLPDLPSHSESRDIELKSIEDAATHVSRLIRAHAHGSRAHVVGLSMGGFIAQRLAIEHPSLVSSLFVSGAEPYRGLRLFIAHQPRILYWAVWLILFLPDWLYWQYASWIGFRRHEALLVEMRRNCSQDMLRNEFASIVLYRLEDVIKIRARMLVVAGGKQDDVGATAMVGEALRNRGIDGCQSKRFSRAVAVKEALHAWNLQYPELFAYGIRAWIEGTDLPQEFEDI